MIIGHLMVVIKQTKVSLWKWKRQSIYLSTVLNSWGYWLKYQVKNIFRQFIWVNQKVLLLRYLTYVVSRSNHWNGRSAQNMLPVHWQKSKMSNYLVSQEGVIIWRIILFCVVVLTLMKHHPKTGQSHAGQTTQENNMC